MSLLLLVEAPTPDFHPEAGQTVIWPNRDADGHSVNVRSPDGVLRVKTVDPSTLISGVDEDDIARTIEASLGQLQLLKSDEPKLSFLQSYDLPCMSRSEHRPGQRFVMEGGALSVVFNTSKRVAGVNRGDKETSTYLDIGALCASSVVDYSTTSSGHLSHSGDCNYTVGKNGTQPGPGEKTAEPKLVHTITSDPVNATVHLLVAGYSSTPLNRFVGGGVLTFFTPRHLFNVVIDFPEAVFHAVGQPGALSCTVATVRPHNGTLIVDVSVPGAVLGMQSAPFTATKELNRMAQAALLPPLTLPARIQPAHASPHAPANSVQVQHSVDCETVITLESTADRAASYTRLMESMVPDGPVHLLLMNNELLVPITGSPRVQDVEVAVQRALALEGHVDLALGAAYHNGKLLGQNSLKRALRSSMMTRLPVKLQMSGFPLWSTTPASIVHIPDAPDCFSSVLLWTGVEAEHPLRRHVLDPGTAAGGTLRQLHAFSGVSIEPGGCGAVVHIPVALCPPSGLRGNSVLEAATPWSGYAPEQAETWFSGRNLVIAGPMTPGAAACAGPHRIAGVFVMTTDNIAAFRVMAAPASVLLRVCPDDPCMLEWIDGIQQLLPGLHTAGDQIPVQMVVRWVLGQVGCDLPALVPRRTTVGPAGELRSASSKAVFVCPQGVGDARTLADFFLQAEVAPSEVSGLRSVGSPNCHELESKLRRLGETSAVDALQTAVHRLMSKEPPSPTILLEQLQDSLGGAEFSADSEKVVLAMHEAVVAHRSKAADWLTLRYQMAWFGGPEAKQYAIDRMTDGRFAVAPVVAPAVAPATIGAVAEADEAAGAISPTELQQLVAQRRQRVVGRPAKMLTLMFDPADVRTIAQLSIQKQHANLKNAAQQAKGLRIGANVDAVKQWTVGDFADHIDVLCGDLGRCAIFGVDPSALQAGRLDGLVPVRPAIGTADVAALLEIPAARPLNVPPLLPVLNGPAVGTNLDGQHINGPCLCLPIPDEAARAESPWPDLQVRSVQPEGDCLLRVALMRGLEPFLPDLAARRQALRQLFEFSAREACLASVRFPGEYTMQVARGLVLRLLCMWASGQSPLSWAFQMAQPSGMDNLPKPEEWRDVGVLMELWPGTGWSEDLLARNLSSLAGKVIQRSIQPFLTRLQKAKSKKVVNASHPNDHVFMSSNHIQDSMCGECHQVRPMTRGQRRRSCRHGRIKRCVQCCRSLESFFKHPQFEAWNAGELTNPGDAAPAESAEAAAAAAAAAAAVEPVDPDQPVPTRELISSVCDDTVFWRIVTLSAARLEVDSLSLVGMYAKDLYAEPDASPDKKNKMAAYRFA